MVGVVLPCSPTVVDVVDVVQVDLTGIAALFVAVIVVLTLAMLIPGWTKVWLAGAGALMAVVGAACGLHVLLVPGAAQRPRPLTKRTW